MDSGTSSMFKHTLLEDPGKQIRLLQLGPGNESDVIELTVETHELEATPDYFAISYAWGVEDVPSHVSVNGSRFPVRWNCLYALTQVRYHFPGCRLWIDSVCINQSNLEEKSRQVAMMYDIYGTATKVLACVGPHANRSELLAPKTAYEGCRAPIQKSPGTDHTAWQHFGERDYWKRLWIVQEIAAAARRHEDNVQILCGHILLPWRTVVEGAIQVRDSEPRFESSNTRNIETISLVCAGQIELSDVFTEFTDFGCSNMLDRLYSLLKLVEPSSSIGLVVPDYTKTPWDLAQDLCQHLPASRLQDALRALKIDRGSLDDDLQNARHRRYLPEANSSKPHVQLARVVLDADSDRAICIGQLHTLASSGFVIQCHGKLQFFGFSHLHTLNNVRELASGASHPLRVPKSFEKDPSAFYDGHGLPVGWVCAGARDNDLLFINPCVSPRTPSNTFSLLIMRRAGAAPLCQLVGYGIVTMPESGQPRSRGHLSELRLPCSDILLFAAPCLPDNESGYLHPQWGWELLAQSLWWPLIPGGTATLHDFYDYVDA